MTLYNFKLYQETHHEGGQTYLTANDTKFQHTFYLAAIKWATGEFSYLNEHGRIVTTHVAEGVTKDNCLEWMHMMWRMGQS